LQRDGTDEIALADLHAAMPQNVVSGREVEVVVRQHKEIEIVRTLHLAGGAAAERKFDIAVGGRIDLLGIERLQVSDAADIEKGMGTFLWILSLDRADLRSTMGLSSVD
jgi:hypothetical protein